MTIIGRVVAVVTGVAIGLVCLVVTWILNADSSWVALFVFTVPVLGGAIALWLTHGVGRRGVAVGLTAGWVVGGVLIWWFPSGSSMSPGEIHRATARILAAGVPAYYPGERADGRGLSAVYGGPDLNVDFSYGACRSESVWGGDGGCTPEIQADTTPLTQAMMQAYSDVRCRRLAPVLGVPTAVLNGELSLFTGSSRVSVAHYDAHRDLGRELAVARTLRPLGHTRPVKSLPPPNPQILAFVDKNCR